MQPHCTAAAGLRAFPRSVRDEVCGWHMQAAAVARETSGKQAARRTPPVPDPALGTHVYRTDWRCVTCRACDSCGSAHPGGPFAQQAVGVAAKLLDAVLVGELSCQGSLVPGPPLPIPAPAPAPASVYSRSLRSGRASIPLWARGGIAGPADLCASDTMACVKAAETAVTAFASKPRVPPVIVPQAGGVAMSHIWPPTATTATAAALKLDTPADLCTSTATTTAAAPLPLQPQPQPPSAAAIALQTAVRKFGFAVQGSSAHHRSTLQTQPRGWATPDPAAGDTMTWGLHSFTPIPGTFQYNARRARALAVVNAAQAAQSGGGSISNVAASAAAAAAGGGASIVAPSEPIEQLLCSYCVVRVTAGCFCPVCHGVYTDGDGYMAQVRGLAGCVYGWWHVSLAPRYRGCFNRFPPTCLSVSAVRRM
jgi:hypothetical protein